MRQRVSRFAGIGLLRHAVHMAFYYSGMFHLLRHGHNSTGRRLTIVTFHRVADRPFDDPFSLPTLFMSQRYFHETVRFLKAHYHVISLDTLLEALLGRAALPPNSLVLTFDDGYQDVFENAVPVLAGQGIPATIFLPTAFIEDNDRVFWWDECYHLLCTVSRDPRRLAKIAGELEDQQLAGRIRAIGTAPSAKTARSEICAAVEALQSYPDTDRRGLLRTIRKEGPDEPVELLAHNATAGWSEVRSAAQNGISFGSHTRTHVFLHRASSDTAREELRKSREEISEKLGRPARVFAYPGGKLTQDVRRWVQDAGYECAVTTVPGINDPTDPPFMLKRISLWNGTAAGPGGSFSKARLAFNLMPGR